MSEPNVVILWIVIATAVALITRRIPVPRAVALVIGGIALTAVVLLLLPRLGNSIAGHEVWVGPA